MNFSSIDFLSAEQRNFLDEILKKYPPKFEKAAMREILFRCLDSQMSTPEIHKVVKSFSYSFEISSRFLTELLRNDLGCKKQNTKAIYNVEVCMNLPCLLRGGGDIMRACEKWLDLPCGSKTIDNCFSLDTASYFHDCTKGPVAIINGDPKEGLTTTQMVSWLQSLLKDEKFRSLNETTMARNPYTSIDTE